MIKVPTEKRCFSYATSNLYQVAQRCYFHFIIVVADESAMNSWSGPYTRPYSPECVNVAF